MSSILIHNGAIITMDGRNTIHTPGWVWLQDGRISAVGPDQPPPALFDQAGRQIDAGHMAVLPGLVNGHTHLSQTFMRGLGDDKPLLDWLKQIMWPLQAAMTPEDMHLASLLGLVENLRCGVTGLVQHHKITTSPAHVDAAARAVETVGLRMCLARGWVDLGTAAESPEVMLAEMARLRQRWHGQAEGRLTVGFGPMAAWRCSDETMRRTVATARDWGLITHIHVAEAQDEIELMKQRNGQRHIEWLHGLGVLGPDVQLVHCVQVTEAELDLIAASGAAVVHCPVSNMYLASGAAPVRQMLDRGIPVALGTDGPASHNSQDLLETMKVGALLAKVATGQATALLPGDVLRMVTTAGARLLQRADLGQIKPGARADLTLINLNTAHSVIVDGRLLLDAGRVTVLDELALLEECRFAARRLLERAGVAQDRGDRAPGK